MSPYSIHSIREIFISPDCTLHTVSCGVFSTGSRCGFTRALVTFNFCPCVVIFCMHAFLFCIISCACAWGKGREGSISMKGN